MDPGTGTILRREGVIMKTLVIFLLGMIAAPLLLVLAGMLGWLGSTGTGTPTGWELSIGGRMVDAALEKRVVVMAVKDDSPLAERENVPIGIEARFVRHVSPPTARA